MNTRTLDELDELAACERAIMDLMCPEQDLANVDRGDLHSLLDRIRRQREAALQALKTDC